MISFPNAKINLGLNITERRTDGYHNLETIFFPIPLHDILEIQIDKESKESFQLFQTGISLEGKPEHNLVVKAYQLLKDKYNLPPINIYLHKIIPSGAGLGGGSADASFMLKLLNEFFRLDLGIQELEELAAKLGADCPFFIQNKPTFAQGVGNIFTPTAVSLKGYQLYLIKPDVFVSTPMAFKDIVPQKPQVSLLDAVQMPIEEWKNHIFNDFEKTIFKQIPKLQQIKTSLYDAGAIYASMSGSGSSIYGIFKNNCPFKENAPQHKFLLKL